MNANETVILEQVLTIFAPTKNELLGHLLLQL